MKIAGVAGAFAEIGNDDVVCLLHLEGQRDAGGHRKVCAEHAGIAEDAELGHAAVQGGIATLRQARFLGEHLRHHHARFHALHQHRAEIAMERTDVVFLAQAETGTHHDGFLSDAGVHAAAHLALPHEQAEPLVEGADELEPIEHLHQLVVGQLELGALERRGTHRAEISLIHVVFSSQFSVLSESFTEN